MRLSPAALLRYRTCPKQFWFADVERAPRPQEDPSPVLVEANAVHHAAQLAFGLPLEQRSVDTFQRALRAVWRKHRGPDTFGSDEEERAYGRAALAKMQTLAQSFDITPQPLAREQWLSMRVAKGVELFGKVDRIDPAGTDAIDVIDYKTGRGIVDRDDLPDEPAAQVYVLLAEHAFKQPVNAVRYRYLAHGRDVVWTPEREDVQALRLTFGKLIAQITTAEDYPAWPGEHCRYCPFALRCPDRQRVTLDDLNVPAEIGF